MENAFGLLIYLTGIGIAVAFTVRIYLLLLVTQRYLEAKTEAQLRENRKRAE